MAWIELHQAVWTHRKTFELAGLLDLDETYAASHVIRLWSWALDNAPDGDLSSLSARAIAFGAGWRGDAETFVDALVQVGWLDEDRCIHDWQQYAGRLIDRRISNTERMRAARANRVGGGEQPHAQNVHRTTVACAGATVPDTTIPDHTGPDPDLTGPDALVVDGDGGAGGEHGATAPPKQKSGGKAARTLAPESLDPNAADYAQGERLGMSRDVVDSKTEEMLDHWRGRGELRADWHASLREWLRRAPQFDRPSGGAGQPRTGPPRPPPRRPGPAIPTEPSAYLNTRNGQIPRR